jgi:hypothetical protein
MRHRAADSDAIAIRFVHEKFVNPQMQADKFGIGG